MIYNRKHGKYKTPEYVLWCGMKNRCKHHAAYAHVEVCERWASSFENFLADMGERPSPDMTIERVDGSKGYSPDNCVWATQVEQTRNQRKRKDNSTGLRGIGVDKLHGTFKVYINAEGRRHNLGTTRDFFEACCMRLSAQNRLWGDA